MTTEQCGYLIIISLLLMGFCFGVIVAPLLQCWTRKHITAFLERCGLHIDEEDFQ